MNGGRTVDMRDVEVVEGAIRRMLSEKWITLLMPDSEIRALATDIVQDLEHDRSERK